MARRFIVENDNINNIDDNTITIEGKEVKHIQVLRHNIGDEIIINDKVYSIVKMGREDITLKYKKEAPLIGIPKTNVTLYIALLKNDKLDFVIQKAVEIGVKKIVPFTSSNTIVKLDDKGKIKRKEKLQKIAEEACKQCGRMDMVDVADIITWDKMCEKLCENDAVLFAYESSHISLKEKLNDIKDKEYTNIGIIIGAEGGFTPKEAQKLENIDNVACISLGSRILRAETAALNLLSIVLYEMEE